MFLLINHYCKSLHVACIIGRLSWFDYDMSPTDSYVEDSWSIADGTV